MSKGSKVESNLLTHPAPITVLLIAKIVQMSAMKVTFRLPNAAYLMQSYKIPLPNASNSTFFILSQLLFLRSVVERDDC